jgi:small GTP-binding protein
MHETPGARIVKTVTLGNAGTGKTSLIKCFLAMPFNESEPSTIGGQMVEWSHRSHDGDELLFQLWDTAGQEVYRSLVPIYTKGASIALLCYAVNDLASFKALDEWRALVSHESPMAQILVVGTKSDLPEAVSVSDSVEKAREFQTSVTHTSAKTGEQIMDLKSRMIDLARQLRETRQQMPENNERVRTAERKSSCC